MILRPPTRTIAIGAIVELSARFRDVSASPATMIDLAAVDAEVSVRVERIESGAEVVDELCTVDGQRATYAWDTAGLTAGGYRYRFTLANHAGERRDIEPAEWIEVRLVP